MSNDNLQAQSSASTKEMENMYLNFSVGSEVYGVEIQHVIQIIGMQEITIIPEMPPDMKGVINLRGRVIPVFSMRLRFGQFEEEYNSRTCIVVVTIGEKEIGLIVDAIRETVTIEPENISPQPATGTGVENPFIKGIAKFPDNRIVVLLYAQKLFDANSF
jgi:purine-binding chemotaxis protein CheW